MEVDFRFLDHGSLILVNPLHEGARNWLEENTDGLWWCGSLVVEPRLLSELVLGMIEEGWHV